MRDKKKQECIVKKMCAEAMDFLSLLSFRRKKTNFERSVGIQYLMAGIHAFIDLMIPGLGIYVSFKIIILIKLGNSF